MGVRLRTAPVFVGQANYLKARVCVCGCRNALQGAQEMVQEITRKVLVVDDQPDILEAMRLLLKGGAYVAETASSPELALLAASSGKHDLVLIDMNYARDTTSVAEGLALLDMLR